ncbi:putative RNA methyltransferase [Sporolactobacillus laevolacticus]|uniref:Uncharacterized protein n=1 Tax=Sporolactobacillus laevolacticus DSM 442 TaxID=1395513 RepID=V6J5Y6_9BACL|nr:methyltransferase domain-containing protein [Sporolactobacillus laevolacticus]EST12164.1 hypothetical protein P343_08850 [Sporolactobacillus laevolacticus DSM 442]
MNRIQLNAEMLKKNIELLKCPICGESMRVAEMKSLICPYGHTFDIAKQGYVNLLARPVHTHYGKALFEARRNIIVHHGFFNPLIQKLTACIGEVAAASDQRIDLLDLGCGEGSHLAAICQKLVKDYSFHIMGSGVDIAKEGIQLASKHYPDQLWFVGDLAQPAFADHQFDFILNILSPSNYQVFDQLLKPGGRIIKVIPSGGYLKELRTSFYEEEKISYSNAEIKALFLNHFSNARTETVSYVARLNHEGVQDLLQMTPLAWTAAEEKREEWMKKKSAEISVDFDILIGNKSF